MQRICRAHLPCKLQAARTVVASLREQPTLLFEPHSKQLDLREYPRLINLAARLYRASIAARLRQPGINGTAPRPRRPAAPLLFTRSESDRVHCYAYRSRRYGHPISIFVPQTLQGMIE